MLQKRDVWAVFGVAAAMGLDQWSKNWMQHYLASFQGSVEITPWFHVLARWNHGVGWGFFPATSWQGQSLLLCAALILVAILGSWYRQSKDPTYATGLLLVISGGLSNALDRTWHGAVFDFMDFHVYGYHFPTFNIADILISIGFLLLCKNFLRWKSWA